MTTNAKFGPFSLLLAMLIGAGASALAQGTAFTYQGRLDVDMAPANGSYDLRFGLYDNAAGGSMQGPLLTNAAVAISNGLFAVTLDFEDQFDHTNLWLELGVRSNGAGAFTALAPRQLLTPTPYAIRAAAANNLAGTLPVGQLTGQVSGVQIAAGAVGATQVHDAAVQLRVTGTAPAGQFITGIAANGNVTAQADTTDWKLDGNTGGGHFLGSVDNQPLELRVNNAAALRLEPNATSPNVVAGFNGNSVNGSFAGATIAGGGKSGSPNIVTGGDYATVSGGDGNTSSNNWATIGGGYHHIAGGDSSTIGGGYQNVAGGIDTTVGGGENNQSTGDEATVAGGLNNTASGIASMIPGGAQNVAAGNYSFAAGRQAQASHAGAWVWADSQAAAFASTANNQFLIRAAGGVGIGTNAPAGALHVASASSAPQLQISQKNAGDYTRLRMGVASSPFWEMDVSPGASPSLTFWNSTLRMTIDYNGNVSALSFNPTSDRNRKENFDAVDPAAVLQKVATLPITRWNFKGDSGIQHLGPMAQDFRAAFGLGGDDKHIATVDADGVALAAIQGLNQKLDETQAENAQLRAEVAELKRMMTALARGKTGGILPNLPPELQKSAGTTR